MQIQKKWNFQWLVIRNAIFAKKQYLGFELGPLDLLYTVLFTTASHAFNKRCYWKFYQRNGIKRKEVYTSIYYILVLLRFGIYVKRTIHASPLWKNEKEHMFLDVLKTLRFLPIRQSYVYKIYNDLSLR